MPRPIRRSLGAPTAKSQPLKVLQNARAQPAAVRVPQSIPRPHVPTHAALERTEPGLCYGLAPFAGSSEVLGPYLAERDESLRAWSVALAPPRGIDAAPKRALVQQLVEQIVAGLCQNVGFLDAEAWLGGSAALWRLGGLGPNQKPNDLDPIIVVKRRLASTLGDLEQTVKALVRIAYTEAFALSDTDAQGLRLHARRLFETEEYGGLLTFRIGTADAHVDLRFVFDDEAIRPYDFLCNAIVHDMHDSRRWCTLPGADAGQVLADIDAGVYRALHLLAPGSIVRAWKMACRGLVPADAAQERMLWAQLACHLDAEAPDECKGPKLRLAEHLHRHLGYAPQKTRGAERQQAIARVLNALTSLATFSMPKHAEMVTEQLRRLVVSWRQEVVLDNVSTSLIDHILEPGGAARAAGWLALWATPQSTLQWPTEDVVTHLGITGSGLAGCVRYFMPALSAFVILYPPPTDAPWIQAQLAPEDPIAASTNPQTRAAALLGCPTVAPLWPHAINTDETFTARARTAAKRLMALMQSRAALAQAPSLPRILAAALALDADACVPEAIWRSVATQPWDASCEPELTALSLRRLASAAATLTHTAEPQARVAAWQRWHATFADAGPPHAWLSQRLRLLPQAQAMGQTLVANVACQAALSQADKTGLVALCTTLDAPCARRMPDAAAAWLVVRARLGDAAPHAWRQALRCGLNAVRLSIRQKDHTAWQIALTMAARLPRPFDLLATLLQLAPAPAVHTPMHVAQLLLTQAQAGHNTPGALSALFCGVSRLKKEPGMWPKMWGHARFAKNLAASPKHRIALFAHMCAHPPLAYPDVLQCALTLWLAHAELGDLPEPLCTDARTQACLSALVHAAIDEASDLHVVAGVWQRCQSYITQRKDIAQPLVLRLLDAVGQHYPAWAKRTKARNTHANTTPWPLPAEWRTHLSTLPEVLPLGAELGRAYVRYCDGDANSALLALVGHAPQALMYSARSKEFMVCATTLLAKWPMAQQNAPSALRALIGMVTKVPRLQPQARAHAHDFVAAFVVHCSQARAQEVGIKALVHAQTEWQLLGVGAALDKHLQVRAPWHARAAWFATLGWAFNDIRYMPTAASLAEPFAVRELSNLAQNWSDAPSPEQLAQLDAVLRLARTRGRSIARHKDAPIAKALRHLWRMLPDDTARPLLFGQENVAEQYYSAWSWLWMTWIEAAPNAQTAHERAYDVATFVGFGAFEDARAQDLTQQAANVLLQASPQLCYDPRTQCFDLVAWQTIAQACVANTPPMWWLDALCHIDSERQTQLGRMLVEYLDAACRSEILVRRATTAQSERQYALGLSLLHVAAHHLAPDEHALAAQVARTALTLGRSFWQHDPESWLILLDALWRMFPVIRVRLLSLYDKLGLRHKETGFAKAVGYPAWMHTSIAPLLGHTQKALVARGLCLLLQSEDFWPDDTRLIAAWYGAMGALARRQKGKSILAEHLRSEWHASQVPWRNVAMIFDSLYDAHALTEDIWHGVMLQLRISAQRLGTHQPLCVMLSRVTQALQADPGSFGPKASTQLAKWIGRAPRNTPIAQALRALSQAVQI